jgi:hypothetical protein
MKSHVNPIVLCTASELNLNETHAHTVAVYCSFTYSWTIKNVALLSIANVSQLGIVVFIDVMHQV